MPTTKLDLSPVRKDLVYDILRALKVDVSDWKNYKKGKGGSPAANPKYCYRWAFEKPDNFIVLCLWLRDLTEVGTDLVTCH